MAVIEMSGRFNRGWQIRSFRAQRRLTLVDIANSIYGEEVEQNDPESILSETQARKIINSVSRIERGERGARGLKRELEHDLCKALNCTTRELHDAPLGYHMHGSDVTQCESIQNKYKFSTRAVSIDLKAIPTEWRKPEMVVQTSVVYVPPIIDGQVHQLNDNERLNLITISMQYHYPAMVEQLRLSGRDAILLHTTKEERIKKALKIIDQVEWEKVYQPGHVLHAYALHWREGNKDHTSVGFAWDQEWFKTATQQPGIADEVGSTAHPSEYPDPGNPKSIPVLGFARGGEYDMQFVDNGDALERIEAPPFLNEVPEAFAVIVSNDSMEPRYDPGDYLYCHPNKVPRRGDYVVVALTEQRAIVKRFLRQTPESVQLEQLNPQDLIEIDRADVVRIFVIVGTNTP